MKLDKASMLLYVVTDRTWLGGGSLAQQVEQAVQAGATFVQLREKNLGFDQFVEIAAEIKTITDLYRIPYVINDNVDVAIAVKADGVHLGQGDTKIAAARKRLGHDKIIGLSATNLKEAVQAQENGADYIGVGTVFNTTTKPDADTVSIETLMQICHAVQIPVVAIGGISKHNIMELSGTGVDGVAVISAVFAQPDVYKATYELLQLSRKMKCIG